MRHIADRFTVIADANVLYPFMVRDVLLSLAQAGLFRIKWSNMITEEWSRNLIANKPQSESKIRATIDVMHREFPEAVVEGFEPLIASLSLPDSDDRHVLAAAIHADAQHILTNNLKHFPDTALAPYGVDAKTPDDFILSTFELYPIDALAVFREMRARYENLPISKAEFILMLIRAGLTKTAAALKPHIESL
jgi:predicted nucleic acid-binding protein